MNRREFLGTMGAVAALATPLAAQQTKQFRKGICHTIFPQAVPVRECMERASDAGFQGLELSMYESGEITPQLTAADMERLGEQARKVGIEVTDFITRVLGNAPLTSPDPAVREKGMALLKKAIELAPPLGCGSLLVVPGRLGSGPRFEVGYEDAWNRATECLRQVAPFAEKQKVFLGIKNVWSKFILSPLEMRAFVNQFKNPYVGVHFDVGNVMQYGYPQDWIATLGSRIKRVHIKDYKLSQKSEQGRFVELLEGDVDWKGVMAALRAVNYRGFLIPEIGGPQTDQHLRQVSEALDKIIAM